MELDQQIKKVNKISFKSYSVILSTFRYFVTLASVAAIWSLPVSISTHQSTVGKEWTVGRKRHTGWICTKQNRI